MMKKRWTLKVPDKDKTKLLQDQLKIRKVYCEMLINRGIYTFKEAKTFFRPHLKFLHHPEEMKDMAKAIQRINQAVYEDERVLIYGDYDVDGTTAVATVCSFLREQKPKRSIGFYIPDRHIEGYGISKKGIDYAKAQQINLIIVLDCGIKAIEKVAYAKSLGIDVIVCDHHLPGEILPDAYAILNPKQKGCTYPYKELSGCGIGFKLICGLARNWQLPEKTAFKYLDLVATSIAADIVPLTGENRVLATEGLKKLNEQPLPSIQALLTVSELQTPINLKDVAFMIAPRINAAGRLKHAKIAVDLLTERDSEKVSKLAQQLQELNNQRKKLDKTISDEIIAQISASTALKNRKTTVMFHPEWHKGVIGIAASRVIESFYRPTIIFSEYNGEITGSARSVKGFNIYKALKACSDKMERFGGHPFAAGMTLKKDSLEAFSIAFEKAVCAAIQPEMLIPELKIDAEVSFESLTEKFHHMLCQFEPFGPENEQPVFLLKNVTDNGYSKIVGNKHIRFELVQQGCNTPSLVGIGFNLAQKFDIVASGKPLDVCFHLEKNHFNGKSRLQLRVLDVRLS